MSKQQLSNKLRQEAVFEKPSMPGLALNQGISENGSFYVDIVPENDANWRKGV